MKYYLAEYRYSANLAEFEGERLKNSYRVERDTFKSIYGSIDLSRSGLVIEGAQRAVFDNLPNAVEFLLKISNENLADLRRKIAEQEYEQNELIGLVNAEKTR